MITKRKKIIVITAFVLCILAGAMWFRFFRSGYETIVIISPGGEVSPVAINNNGEAAGYYEVGVEGSSSHAFFWSEAEGIIDLGTLGGTDSFAYDINDKGQVVGTAKDSNGVNRGFMWTKQDGMVDLGTFDGVGCTLYGINNHGQIVGQSRLAGLGTVVFVREPDGSVIDVGLPSKKGCFPRDINDKGQVVGKYSLNGKGHAFYWDSKEGTIYIAEENGPSSDALGINNDGQVVGNVFEPKINNYVGFTWSKDEGLKKLTLSDVESSANTINDAGEITGKIRKEGFLFLPAKSYSYLMKSNGSVVDLSNLAVFDNEGMVVTDMNDEGWLIGYLYNVPYKKSYFSRLPVVLKPKRKLQ